MHTFRSLDRQIGLLPGPMARALASVDLGRGREEAFRRERPGAPGALARLARIQSAEASNAIDQITAPHRRIEALAAGQAPANSSEGQIAGYLAVLDTLSANATDMPFEASIVEQLHRDLHQFTGPQPVPATQAPAAMEELHGRFADALATGEHHPLLLIGAYVFDFLAMHPFREASGRMSRLATLLALYRSGYDVGRFVSLERLILETRNSHYGALRAAGHGWHEDQHDIHPWLRYFLGLLNVAHREFEGRISLLDGKGAKERAIEQFIRSSGCQDFTVAEIRQFAAGISQSHLSKTLARLRDEGIIQPRGAGRGARWRRLREDF